MSLITIIVPVYNTEQYLQRCIDSIIAQSFDCFDLVIVNDGSTDDSATICHQYAQIDERIILINQENQGLSAARNAGITWSIEHSDSKYLSFVDSDDWIHPRYLEWLYEAIQRKNITLAVGKYTKVYDDCIFDNVVSISNTTSAQLYCKNGGNCSFNVAWGKLFPKEDFHDIRFPLGKLHEDEFTIWKIMFKHNEIAIINTPIYAYCQRSDSIMGTWSPDRLVCIDAVKEQLEWIKKQGNEEMLAKAKQRMAVVYTGAIKGMIQYGMPEQNVREYRKELRGYIRQNRKELPLLPFRSTYEIAWPIIRYVVFILKKVKHGVHRVVNIGKVYAGEKDG